MDDKILHQIISNRLDQDSLQRLCSYIRTSASACADLELDRLPGNGVVAKSLSLIAYCRQRFVLSLLVENLHTVRSDILSTSYNAWLNWASEQDSQVPILEHRQSLSDLRTNRRGPTQSHNAIGAEFKDNHNVHTGNGNINAYGGVHGNVINNNVYLNNDQVVSIQRKGKIGSSVLSSTDEEYTQFLDAVKRKNNDRIIQLGSNLMARKSKKQGIKFEVAEAYKRRGEKLLNNKDYQRAITEFTCAIERNAKDDGYYYLRARSYYGKGDHKSALADISRAIKRFPKNAEYRYLRGSIYFYNSDYNDAILNLQIAIVLDPAKGEYKKTLSDSYYFRAINYYNQRMYKLAQKDCNSAIRLNGEDSSYLDLLNQCIQRIEERVSVEGTLQGEARIHIRKALGYYSRAMYDQAMSECNKAHKLQPTGAQIYYCRGRIYHKKGDYKKAIEEKSQAINLDPNNDLFYQQRGLSYYFNRNYALALLDLNYAIKLGSDVAESWYLRGCTFKALGDKEAARADLQTAINMGYIAAKAELAML